MTTVDVVETLEREKLEIFVKERIREEKQRTCMHDPIKLPLFRSTRQKEPSKDKQQIASLKSDCARLFISRQTREADVYFEHENQGCPPSISQNGKLRLPGKKSP